MEESNVVLIEMAHVVDVVFQHYDTLNSEAECKSAVYFGIDPALAQHIRMYHSRAEYFDPALAFAKAAALAAADET